MNVKIETLIVYGALVSAAIFVALVLIATLKAGSDEDDWMGCDECEDDSDWF